MWIINILLVPCYVLCTLVGCVWYRSDKNISVLVQLENTILVIFYVFCINFLIAFVFLEGRGYVNFLLAAYRWLLKFSGCDAMWVIFYLLNLVILLILASSSCEDIVMMGITIILHEINCLLLVLVWFLFHFLFACPDFTKVINQSNH